MAAIKKTKPNVTPKASEIEVTESEEVKVNEEEVTNEATAEAVETSEVTKPTDDDEVTIDEDETVAVPKDKMVKIRPRADHRCNIGGVTYDLKKNVVTTVPEFVKSVLLKADLLQSL